MKDLIMGDVVDFKGPYRKAKADVPDGAVCGMEGKAVVRFTDAFGVVSAPGDLHDKMDGPRLNALARELMESVPAEIGEPPGYEEIEFDSGEVAVVQLNGGASERDVRMALYRAYFLNEGVLGGPGVFDAKVQIAFKGVADEPAAQPVPTADKALEYPKVDYDFPLLPQERALLLSPGVTVHDFYGENVDRMGFGEFIGFETAINAYGRETEAILAGSDDEPKQTPYPYGMDPREACEWLELLFAIERTIKGGNTTYPVPLP